MFTHVSSSEIGSKPKCHMDAKMTSSGCNHSDTPEPRLFGKASQQAVGPRAGKATSPTLRSSAKSWDELKDTLGKG